MAAPAKVSGRYFPIFNQTLTMTANLFARVFRLWLLPALLIAGFGCTTTITRQKEPVYAESTDSLQAQLIQLVLCEHFNVNGREVTTNGKVTSALEIEIINGKSIPEDTVRIKALAAAIASDIKKALKDPNEYGVYRVLFVTVTTNGGVTRRRWKGQVFNGAEL
jgi:hypothetical protein